MRKFKFYLIMGLSIFLFFNGGKNGKSLKKKYDKKIIKEILKDYEFFKYFNLFKSYEIITNINKVTSSNTNFYVNKKKERKK